MREAAKPPATTKKQAPRKRAGRKPGQKPYSLEQRSAALSILDFCDGDLTRASKSLGIKRQTLGKWRDEMRTEATQKALTDGSLSIAAKLTKMAESLCAIALTKAQNATIGEIRQLLDVILSQIEKLSKADRIDAARAQLHPAVETPEPKTQPPSFDVERQKAHWEAIVQQVMQQAQSEGRPMTREQAIALIVESRPEAKQYLMPDAMPYLM